MAEKSGQNIKNLTITELKKKSKELGVQTEHTIDIGGDTYKFKIDNIFRQTKQHQLMEDLISFFDEGNNRNEILDLATPYITLLLIKHFTSLEIPDDIDGAIDMLNVFTDLEILGDILNLMPTDEVVKMYELLQATVARMNENMLETEKETKMLSEVVENDALKEILKNGRE